MQPYADLDLKAFTVQSSYKLNLPRYLIIYATNLELLEAIGQGNKIHYKKTKAILKAA